MYSVIIVYSMCTPQQFPSGGCYHNQLYFSESFYYVIVRGVPYN